MPTLTFDKKELINLIGKNLKDDELEELINSLKSNVEEITENEIKVELTTDRSDMFVLEGFARALRDFIGLGSKDIKIYDSKIIVKQEEVPVRPYIACALVRNVKLDEKMIKNLMNAQEVLHETIGRKRRKAAIGLHDFDKIEGEIWYKGVSRNEKFVPLGETEEMSLIDVLSRTEKGRKYGELIINANKWPVFVDKKGIFSFPPILNSERTKITEKTKNIFIDVTGTDKNVVKQAINILTLMFGERGFKIEGIKIKGGRELFTPEWIEKPIEIDRKKIEKLLGETLSDEEIKKALKKMGYKVIIKESVIAIAPPYRFDIFSEADVIEDIAIAYGYNNFTPELPNVFTKGELTKVEKISDEIRELLIGFGFQEIIRPILTNEEIQFKKMLVEGDAIKISNPVSELYTQTRIWLLPGLMDFLSKNTKESYPQKIFEIGDVILIDKNSETRARDLRKVAAVIASNGSFFAEAKSIVLEIAKKLKINVEFKEDYHPSFIDGRFVRIYSNKEEIGFFGEINPQVLENFKVYIPVTALEMKISESNP
ncbi:MAG: phenylalanine--tRNA ligase subunit beta [Candidatus Aenigmatarchaeota archaeon]